MITVLPDIQTIRRRLCGWLIPLLCLFGGVARGEDALSREYQLKAAFLYNFTKFVDWPAPAFPASDSPLVIGVFRTNPFGSELENAVKDRKFKGRRIVVILVPSAAAARQTHILFVGATEDSNLAELNDALKGSAVLTVGESPAFKSQGGMITFQIQNDSLRFTIHKESAQRIGMKISAQLQKLAAKPGGVAP